MSLGPRTQDLEHIITRIALTTHYYAYECGKYVHAILIDTLSSYANGVCEVSMSIFW
jgi:hypothetical protein